MSFVTFVVVLVGELRRISLVGGEGRVLDREVDEAFRAMGVVEGM
jgi:hypothetical protein